jgi:hypothetical protein
LQLSALPGCDVEQSVLLGTDPHSGHAHFALVVPDQAVAPSIGVEV